MAYKDLPLNERHALIREAVANGIHRLSDIEAQYNASLEAHTFDDGGSKRNTPTLNEYISDKIDSIRVAALESARRTPSEKSVRFYRYDPEAAKQYRDVHNPDNFMQGTIFNALVNKYLGDIDRAKQEYHIYLYNNNPGYAASYDKYQDALKHGDYIEQANCIANLSRFYPKGLPNGNQTFAANPSKWGFTKIDTWDVLPGDLVQHLNEEGIPRHAMMYNGIDNKGVHSFNYANGSGPNSWGVGKHYPGAVSSDEQHLWDVNVYRYTGTPQDSLQWTNEWLQRYGQNEFAKGGSIHIKPENRGKFNATKARTGKTTEELTHSKNPLTRKRAIFAQNARKWKHDEGGYLDSLFAEGGGIHIAPSKRGTFTAAATKHGKSVQAFASQVLAHKENYSPAMVKKANFARNAAHWHDDGGIIDWVKSLFGNNEAPVETPAPKPTGRVRRNDSPTQAASERLENRMHQFVTSGETNKEYPVTTSTAYDIPYLMDKEIKVKGVGRVSSNALDSVAKYAAQAGIPLYEGLGLAAQETAFGAAPVINYIDGNTEHNRALGNASYFRNFGSIPAQYFVRDFEYDKGGRNSGKPYDRSIPPLLHAFEYWKQGNYNRGDANHTSDVKAKGKQVIQDASVQQWLKESGQRIYDENKKSTGGPLYPFSFNKPLPPVRY